MHAYHKGKRFENNSYFKLATRIQDGTLGAFLDNPYTFKMYGKRFHVLRNPKIGLTEPNQGHETDLAIVDDYVLELINKGATDIEIGNREKGILIIKESKDYNKNTSISVANELTAKSYLMKPNFVIIETNDEKGITHGQNFEKCGIEHCNYSFTNETLLDLLYEDTEHIKNTFENNKTFFESNYNRLKRKTAENNYYDTRGKKYESMRVKEEKIKNLEDTFEKGKKILIVNSTDKINISDMRQAFGRAVTLDLVEKDTVIAIYYNPEKGFTKPAKDYADMINQDRIKKDLPYLFIFIENKANKNTRKILDENFKSLKVKAENVKIEYREPNNTFSTGEDELKNSFCQEVKGITIAKSSLN